MLSGLASSGEILAAFIATVSLTIREAHNPVMLAMEAKLPLGEANLFKILAARILTIKDFHGLR